MMVFVCVGGVAIDCGCGDGDDDDDDNDDRADDDEHDDDVDGDDEDDDDDETSDDDISGEVWTDTVSGLMWTIDPAEETMNWAEADAYCNGSVYGGVDDWRLPTISELRSLIRGCDVTAPGGACGVTDDCLNAGECWSEVCWECVEGTGPADGIFWPSELRGPGGWYWSASLVADYSGWAWAIPFWGGDIDTYDMSLDVYVRCVRP
ncbi:MAG: DUF1566 domain-containing protein [Deltaproteobacteria bacterium]|nr:DUF1566 domain-containing protein [Deltaproteobacteria bacterium]